MSRSFQTIIFVAIIITLGLFHSEIKKKPDTDYVERLSDYIAQTALWMGKVAPDFELEYLNGEKFVLSDHVGKKFIILNFFATWCGPCKEEMPELIRYYEENKDKGVLLIGIDARETKEEVEKFVEEYKMTFPVGIDYDPIMDKYGVDSYPTTVVIGADGKVMLYETGPIANADITFNGLFKSHEMMVKNGMAVTKDQYLALYAQEDYDDVITEEDDDDDGPKLSGRAEAIAKKMACPCGCNHMMEDCSCNTADMINEKLIEFPWDDSISDKDIIKELNKEFCMVE